MCHGFCSLLVAGFIVAASRLPARLREIGDDAPANCAAIGITDRHAGPGAGLRAALAGALVVPGRANEGLRHRSERADLPSAIGQHENEAGKYRYRRMVPRRMEEIGRAHV